MMSIALSLVAFSILIKSLYLFHFQGLHVAPPPSHTPSSRGRGGGSSGSVVSPTSAVSSTLPLYTLRGISTLPAEVSLPQYSLDCWK